MYLGIDFGTSTNFIVSLHDNQQLYEEQFGDYGQSNVFSNVIYYTNSQYVIGPAAVRRIEGANPLNLIRHVKSHMGDDNWQTFIPAIGRHLKAQEIATDIFRAIRTKVEQNHGNECISAAVLSVPYAFLYHQRQSIKQAATDAGIPVIGLIEEPVAAALRFISLNQLILTNVAKNILIFDFGGGTLDVTVFSCYNNGNVIQIEVLNTDGNKALGGSHITECLENFFASKLNVHVDQLDKSLREEFKHSLHKLAEETKITLSYEQYADIFEYFSTGDILELVLSRDELNSIITLGHSFKCDIEQVLDCVVSDIGLSFSDIDEIVLVGGSSKLSFIKDIIVNLFGREPIEYADGGKLVGEGAAVYCSHVLANNTKYNIISRLSQSIGISKNGRFVSIINKNTKYDFTSPIEWFDATGHKLSIYQGNTSDITQCTHIGDITLNHSTKGTIGTQLTLSPDGKLMYCLYEKKFEQIIKIDEGEIPHGNR
ncbi:MAG: hypothetical protein BEN18_04920 [Epulopiscium sp. Nuni2H_MBin001]|nr:MAG: hypothetical protein BEN18_04920 [Epulopiscium sp. Nuni2H_MBin001]